MLPFERDEPTLRDLLDDPLIQQVMSSDAVTQDDVRTLFERLKLDRQIRGTDSPLPA